MMSERQEAIPKSPTTFEEAIAGLEANLYPDLYQDMYLGHVSHEFEGNEGNNNFFDFFLWGSFNRLKVIEGYA